MSVLGSLKTVTLINKTEILIKIVKLLELIIWLKNWKINFYHYSASEFLYF